MVLPDFLIAKAGGYYCSYGDFYIDAGVAVMHNVVSHAHADHARPGSLNLYTTASTVDFMKIRYGASIAKNIHPITYHQAFKLGDVTISFYPAGHMLGSAQILMEYKGVRYLYSGDIKLQEDHSCEPALVPPCDVLITESTFAYPNIVHPSVFSEIENLRNFQLPLIIGCYALGKAQRLRKLIEEIIPDIPCKVHYDISRFNAVYRKHGYLLGPDALFEKSDVKRKKPYIYLVPPLTYNSYKSYLPFSFAFASGWSALQNSSTPLYVSDHLDWPDLLRYIEMSKATEVWSIHGESKHLLEHYGSSSIKVRPLENARGN
jgi:putative mRNA 3-end processing factor